jgi:hypothetical protein
MRSGWASLIRAEAETVPSSEQRADGSSSTVSGERDRRQSATAGSPEHSVGDGTSITLRLERYTAQDVGFAQMTFVVDPIIPWSVK